MLHNPIGRARLHVLQALTHLVDARQMHLPPKGQAELAGSLEHLDDLLSGILTCLSRAGLRQRKECFDLLDATLAQLDQLINCPLVERGSILEQILALARSYINMVRGELRFVPDKPEEEPSPLVQLLTEVENQVIKLAAQGFTQGEIASRLKLSTAMVRARYGQIPKKLKCRNMIQVVAMYVAAECEEFE